MAFEKAQIKDAPTVEGDEELSMAEEERLYRHYGLGYSQERSETGLEGGRGRTDAPRADATTGTRDNAMTRSEEELHVGTQPREAGRARIRKWVDTERVGQQVPVSHEQVKAKDMAKRNFVDTEAGRDPSPLAGEDLSRGPTPETRHPDGGRDDVEDTTQGPTPETRRADRAGKDDPAAFGEPRSDPRTRVDRGGNQDRTDSFGRSDRIDEDRTGADPDDLTTRRREDDSI